ncbi:phage tail protein [Dokdonella soli]|uniref:Tail fiber protein n=1 Tax=Dokdonella soli TaxID=529810 RepID=A0ABN1IMF7_9GAMM
MANPFLAEIRLLPFNFPPKGWAFCAGQIYPISQNTALFSLLGTTYGGNGTSNFALPNLQGCAAMHPGQGLGLSLHNLGETGGSETVTLLQSEMPAHTHTVSAQDGDGAVADPTNNFIGNSAGLAFLNGLANTSTHPMSTSVAGGNQPHNNMMPYLTLNYCIAMQGVYPSRG